MLHNQYLLVARLGSNRVFKNLIRDYFTLPIRDALLPAMLARGLGQADLVFCLLHLRDAHPGLRSAAESYITMLVGQPIKIGPSCLQSYRVNGKPRSTLDRSPRIVHVHHTNPRLPNTEAFLRWPEFKVGRSTAQLRARGLKPKDIRLAARNGWIQLQEQAA